MVSSGSPWIKIYPVSSSPYGPNDGAETFGAVGVTDGLDHSTDCRGGGSLADLSKSAARRIQDGLVGGTSFLDGGGFAGFARGGGLASKIPCLSHSSLRDRFPDLRGEEEGGCGEVFGNVFSLRDRVHSFGSLFDRD